MESGTGGVRGEEKSGTAGRLRRRMGGSVRGR
jgi:hypothetical protein